MFHLAGVGGADLGAAAALLPYPVILRTDGPRKILAILRRYKVTRPDGTGKIMKLRQDAMENPSQAMGVGELVLLSPMAVVGTAASNKIVFGSGRIGAEAGRWLPLFQSAQKVEFSVDSVVFEDGEIAGPDTAQYGRDIDETQRARRDFKAAVPETGDLRSGLQSQLKNDVANRATPNPDFYNIEWDVMARSLLMDCDAIAPAEARRRIEWLGTLPQVTIKRKAR